MKEGEERKKNRKRRKKIETEDITQLQSLLLLLHHRTSSFFFTALSLNGGSLQLRVRLSFFLYSIINTIRIRRATTCTSAYLQKKTERREESTKDTRRERERGLFMTKRCACIVMISLFSFFLWERKQKLEERQTKTEKRKEQEEEGTRLFLFSGLAHR